MLNPARSYENYIEDDLSVTQERPDWSSRTHFRSEVSPRREKITPSNARNNFEEQFTASKQERFQNSGEEEEERQDIGVFRIPARVLKFPQETKLQEWEGQVQEVDAHHFTARLVDITSGDKEETEEADLSIDDLSEGDRELLVPGAVFRWIIGHRFNYGQKERFSRLVIRKLPIWTEAEIKAADREANELYNELFGNDHERPTGNNPA